MVPPSETIPPPDKPVPVEIVSDEFARLAFVMPAVPDKFAFVNPETVFEAAVIVLLVSVSVVEAVINPVLFVHCEILALEKFVDDKLEMVLEATELVEHEGQESVIVSPNATVPPPLSGEEVVIVTDALARLVLVSPPIVTLVFLSVVVACRPSMIPFSPMTAISPTSIPGFFP